MFRFFAAFCLAHLGLLGSVSAGTAAPIIAVIESAQNTAPRGLRLEIRPTVEAALRERGATVVPRVRMGGALAKCADQACAIRVGAATGATHVFAIDSSYADDGYRIHLQVFDARTGRELNSDGQVCEVCTHDDFTKALRERTAILWSRIQAAEASASLPTRTVTAAPPTPTAPPHQPLERQDHETASVGRKLVGPVLVATGAAAAIVGGVYMSRNGDPATGHGGCQNGAPCPFTRRTLGWSAPMTGAGVATAILGAYLWWTTPSGTSLALSVGRDGLFVSGAY
jgi:hypothetical protein